MVEPKLIWALLKGFIWVGQRVYVGREAHMQSEGRSRVVRKVPVVVD